MNNDKQDLRQVYLSLCTYIATEMEEIKHIDLYYGQEAAIGDDGNWMPFQAPAVWIEFNAVDIADHPEGLQKLVVDVGFYLVYETVQDTNHGSLGQNRALAFFALLRLLHNKMHGRTSEHHGPLTRVGYARVDAPPTMIIYKQTYRCVMLDYGATPNFNETENPIPLEQQRPAAPPVVDEEPLFVIRP